MFLEKRKWQYFCCTKMQFLILKTMRKISLLCATFFCLSSCISTKLTIKNIDDSAVKPRVENNRFIITETSNDKKYGYDSDYPINIGFNKENEAVRNIQQFFNALSDEAGANFTYEKMENCCPFPTKRTAMGAGTLDVYQVTFASGLKKTLYFNIYEKGKIMCPVGFKIKP